MFASHMLLVNKVHALMGPKYHRLDEPDSVSWTIWYNKLLRVAQHIWHTLDQMCILGPILVSRTFNSFMETNHKHFGWCAPVAVGSICCFRTHNDSVILIVLLSFCFFCFLFFINIIAKYFCKLNFWFYELH